MHQVGVVNAGARHVPVVSQVGAVSFARTHVLIGLLKPPESIVLVGGGEAIDARLAEGFTPAGVVAGRRRLPQRIRGAGSETALAVVGRRDTTYRHTVGTDGGRIHIAEGIVSVAGQYALG